MKCDILIKSYAPDYEFLTYCLRSIHKFARGFNQVLVLLPRSHPLPLTAETVVYLDTHESYMTQQIAKLNADLHTEADFIYNLDSDCILTKPITPEMFMVGDKPRWLMTPWEDCREVFPTWAHIMVKCVQDFPQHEFMRRHGIIVPRWAYAAFREFIEKTHGQKIDSYVVNQPGHEFSEWNCLGFYLWKYHRDKIAWHDTSTMGVPENQIEQAHSWSGMTPEIREHMEAVLA